MVHPTTEKMYREAGLEFRKTTEDLVKERFDAETRGKPRRYRIDQMYRVRQIDKDFIVYNQTIFSEDFPGNERTCSETVGFHDEPVFQKRYDESTGQPKPVSVQGNNTVYDIPATKENMLKILKGKDNVPTNTNFVILDSNMKYSGFAFDEFTSRHFDDLLHKSTKGYYPRELKPFGGEEEKEEQEEGSGKIKQLKKDLIVSTSDVPEGGPHLEVAQNEQRPSDQQEIEKEQDRIKKEEEKQAKREEKERERLAKEQEKERERLEKEQEKQEKEQQKKKNKEEEEESEEKDNKEETETERQPRFKLGKSKTNRQQNKRV